MTILLVALLHGLLVAVIAQALRHGHARPAAAGEAAQITWLHAAAIQSAEPAPDPRPAPRIVGARIRPAPLPAPVSPSVAAITLPSAGNVIPAPAASAPAAPASAATASQPTERLLDTVATRRAIREFARDPLLSERAAEGERASASEQLAAKVQKAGVGDCMKGEFAGSGMGLLSLPALAFAEATGNCAK